MNLSNFRLSFSSIFFFMIALVIASDATQSGQDKPPVNRSDSKPSGKAEAQKAVAVGKAGKVDKVGKKDEVVVTKTLPAISLKEKEQLLDSTLGNVSSSAFQIEPVEYSILVQVEAASLLWDKEREQANDELANAWARLRELLSEKKASRLPEFGNKMSEAERMRLKQAILRRIAKLNPNLIKDWTAEKSAEAEKSKPAVATDVEGGTAIFASAVEELQRDPETAMKLAEHGLMYGADYAASTFLTQLWYKDKQLAEKQALVYLEKLPAGSVSNLFLITKLHFFLSPPMHERYFQSLAARLRASLRLELSVGECRELLSVNNKGMTQATTHPIWRDEFVRLANEAEALLASRSAVASTAKPTKAINTSGMSAATPGDTAEIEHSSQKLEAIRNQKLKDSEYQRLAIEAAEKADIVLAERLLLKISDDAVRRQTSIGVYGPLVRKSLEEKDWPQARSYALKVADPLGLSLIVDTAAKAMLNAKQDKQLVRSFYADALANLDRETPSLYVAKAAITIAKSRLIDEPEDGFFAVNQAVSVLNKSELSEPYSSKTGLAKGLATWVNQTNLILREDDYFDVTETLGPLFRDLSKRDLQRTQDLASALTHQGLRSLAQLGLAKGVQEDLQKAKGKGSAGKPKPSEKEK